MCVLYVWRSLIWKKWVSCHIISYSVTNSSGLPAAPWSDQTTSSSKQPVLLYCLLTCSEPDLISDWLSYPRHAIILSPNRDCHSPHSILSTYYHNTHYDILSCYSNTLSLYYIMYFIYGTNINNYYEWTIRSYKENKTAIPAKSYSYCIECYWV